MVAGILASSMPLSARRMLASGINILMTVLISLPLMLVVEEKLWRQVTFVLVFLMYNVVCECVIGRCVGGVVAGITWRGKPSKWRRLAFCFTYTVALLPYVFLPLWQAIPNLWVQWLWGKYVGGTIHSWVVGLESHEIP
jgi:hypothetical protein